LLGRIGSALKSGLKRAVGAGARAVSRGARNVARKMETKKSEAPKTAPKKVEKPADPWEGSATTPAKVKAKPTTKKPVAAKAKAPAAAKPATPKRKRTSKLDSLLSDIRKEEVEINEKILTDAETKKKEEFVKSMKSQSADFEKRYPGRGKEVMYATATKMAKKIAEQMNNEPSVATATSAVDNKKEMMDDKKLANLKMLQQKKQQIDRQKLQLQRTDKLPLEASYQPEGELVDENSTSIKMSLEDYMMVKKDGSRVRMPGDPPKAKKEPGGYDYTPTKEQQAAMKKLPKTKIGSRFD
jgi:hypothetical protein